MGRWGGGGERHSRGAARGKDGEKECEEEEKERVIRRSEERNTRDKGSEVKRKLQTWS